MSISASRVSEINKELGVQVEHFRTRPVKEKCPFLLINIFNDKALVEDRVANMAPIIEHMLSGLSVTEILAIKPIYSEQDASEQAILRKLKERRLDSKFLPSVRNPRHFQSGAYHLLGGAAWLPYSWAPISGAEPT